MSKGNDRIIVQSSNDYSKTAERLLNKTEVIHISQKTSSRTSEVIDWSLMKTRSMGLLKNNTHIVTCNDMYTVQAFRNSGVRKWQNSTRQMKA